MQTGIHVTTVCVSYGKSMVLGSHVTAVYVFLRKKHGFRSSVASAPPVISVWCGNLYYFNDAVYVFLRKKHGFRTWMYVFLRKKHGFREAASHPHLH